VLPVSALSRLRGRQRTRNIVPICWRLPQYLVLRARESETRFAVSGQPCATIECCRPPRVSNTRVFFLWLELGILTALYCLKWPPAHWAGYRLACRNLTRLRERAPFACDLWRPKINPIGTNLSRAILKGVLFTSWPGETLSRRHSDTDLCIALPSWKGGFAGSCRSSL
jgi:hypothetical protein